MKPDLLLWLMSLMGLLNPGMSSAEAPVTEKDLDMDLVYQHPHPPTTHILLKNFRGKKENMAASQSTESNL